MSSASRESFVFAIEDEFAVTPSAKEGDSQLRWFVPPPGSWFTSSHSRSVNSIYEVGRKRLTDYNYGKISGTWQWSFVLDYNYLEPFLLVFEDYAYNDYQTTVDQTGSLVWADWGVHTFKKNETDTVRSFSVMRKRLHRVAGGVADEVIVYNGCVCTTLSLTQANTTSEVRVTMSGVYSTETMDSDAELDGLDIIDSKSPKLVAFGCVYNGSTMMTNVQNWEIRIGNNVKAIYGVGYPAMRSYFENESAYSFSLTAFANNPKQLAQRVYSGGYRNDLNTPIREGALPIPVIDLKSRSEAIQRFPAGVQDEGAVTPTGEYSELRYAMDIHIVNCTVNAMTWTASQGERLLDKLSNGGCEYMEFKFVNMFPRSYLAEDYGDAAWDKHIYPPY